ncbi:MAG TPA: DUF4349 domain-containing protein [Gemmatimonadaceae bacterium]|nr:DUF4349 domain-containing protein [Gemmatimonadaceae bacterium]
MLTSSYRSFALVSAALVIACGENAAPERGATDAVGLQEGYSREKSIPEAAPAPPAMGVGRAGSATEVSQAARDPSQVRVTDSAAAPSMLIRTGTATVEVDSLEIAMQQVRDLAQRLGGYVANTQLASGRDQIRTATLEMKIPAARWGDAVSGLKPIGKVEALNEYTEDVGEEYVDVSARVQNAKRLESRLIELLGNRTGRLSDVLAVERELARVREEIERYEGRLRYLRTRAAMSSMSVTVHEAFPVVGARGETGVLGDAFKQAWRNFVSFIAGIIAATGILIPLAAIALLAWIAWRRWGPRRPPKSEVPGAKA